LAIIDLIYLEILSIYEYYKNILIYDYYDVKYLYLFWIVFIIKIYIRIFG